MPLISMEQPSSEEAVTSSGGPWSPSTAAVSSSSSERVKEGVPLGGLCNGLRPHSTPATLLWLEANYEMADGVCIPRNTLYRHYVDFCARNGMQPVNAASFGKIIRQQFPQLTTRRLGTRGQSRYHYYGIAIRDTSPYFDITYSRKGAASGDVKKEPVAKQAFPSRTRVGTRLPDFPRLAEVGLPPELPSERVATLAIMYRAHCQRLLDTASRATFDEAQGFLLHFWQGMPSHLRGLLSSNAVVSLLGVCDCILYRAICAVLMPSVLQALPDSLTPVIRRFARDLEGWLKQALEDLPGHLRNLKLDLARHFSQLLRRQTSLNHLCQAFRMVIHSAEITSQMLQDWRNVDLESVCRQTIYTMGKRGAGVTKQLVSNLYHEFERLLEEQAPIESYTEWLETIVQRCVVLPAHTKKAPMRDVARHFLLVWSCFGTRVIRDMTLHSAPSFGSFHLMHLMFNDYVLYLVELLHLEERAKELLRNVALDAPPTVPDVTSSNMDETVGVMPDSFLVPTLETPSTHATTRQQEDTGCNISSEAPGSTEAATLSQQGYSVQSTYGYSSYQYDHRLPSRNYSCGVPFYQAESDGNEVESLNRDEGNAEGLQLGTSTFYTAGCGQGSSYYQDSGYANGYYQMSYEGSSYCHSHRVRLKEEQWTTVTKEEHMTSKSRIHDNQHFQGQ